MSTLAQYNYQSRCYCRALELAEMIDLEFADWCEADNENGKPVIKAYFKHNYDLHCVSAKVDAFTGVQELEDLLFDRFQQEVERLDIEQERLNQEWEHPRHTQGY